MEFCHRLELELHVLKSYNEEVAALHSGHLASSPGHSHVFNVTRNIENVGVAWGRGTYYTQVQV